VNLFNKIDVLLYLVSHKTARVVYMRKFFLACLMWFGATTVTLVNASDVLPHWNESASKAQIIEFVTRVTDPASAEFVPISDRIAVFDNDGTLWSEQPLYVQLAFLIDRIKAQAPDHPEWQTTQPFKAVLEGDLATLKHGGKESLLSLLAATHAGMTSEAFRETVRAWLATAKHPQTGLPYTALVYQPMLSLLSYLRANGFKIYIVSGGGVAFVRAWAEDVYGIPPEQVIGTSLASEFVMRDGVPQVVRLPQVSFIDDRAGKPIAIDHHIGKRPVMAFGNSDGDLEMLQWSTAGSGPRFGLIVHHTDDVREVAYDRQSSIGKLDRALDMAQKKGWTVVDMKNDWATVFAPIK
jgi:phosphoserine phosphatase